MVWCSTDSFREHYDRPDPELMEKFRKRIFKCNNITAQPRQVCCIDFECIALSSNLCDEHVQPQIMSNKR